MKKPKPRKLVLNKTTVTNLSRIGSGEANAAKGGTISGALCTWISHCVTACNTCKALTCYSVCDTCEANTCDACATWCSECYTKRYC